MMKTPRPRKAAVPQPLQGKPPGAAIVPATVVRAVVAIVTVNGAGSEPLTLIGFGLTEQVAAVGAPEQAKLTDPENPLPVTDRL